MDDHHPEIAARERFTPSAERPVQMSAENLHRSFARTNVWADAFAVKVSFDRKEEAAFHRASVLPEDKITPIVCNTCVIYYSLQTGHSSKHNLERG